MDNSLKPFDFRKKITNQFQLTQLTIISEHWGACKSDICWRFITDGIANEKKKREEIEELKKQRR